MKTLLNLMTIGLLFLSASAQADVEGQYGIHLFFNEKEFVDVMTIRRSSTGALVGDMHVPNDFEGPLANLFVRGTDLAFEVLVPRNGSRPQDLVFEYRGRFFDGTHEQVSGFVTIKGRPGFVASFIGFKRRAPAFNGRTGPIR